MLHLLIYYTTNQILAKEHIFGIALSGIVVVTMAIMIVGLIIAPVSSKEQWTTLILNMTVISLGAFCFYIIITGFLNPYIVKRINLKNAKKLLENLTNERYYEWYIISSEGPNKNEIVSKEELSEKIKGELDHSSRHFDIGAVLQDTKQPSIPLTSKNNKKNRFKADFIFQNFCV